MSDPLLRYYEQELTFVRRALGQFGSEHPEHAQRLNIHQGQIEDSKGWLAYGGGGLAWPVECQR